MIQKILIANRGEISVRIIRTCREMGISTVAVYSDSDRAAPHVLLADEAYYLGPSPSTESYLNTAKIIEVIRVSQADALHPGYGFLSENAQFAEDITGLGIKWIGPSPESIILMGDKMSARALAIEAGAPIVPGNTEPVTSVEDTQKLAEEIGYPVLIKAAGGGGGKGMRIVSTPTEMEDALNRARSEAMKSFADDRIYMEKYLEEPHHIEVQVFADTQGNSVSLGERECSVQRRYQKIIEESPSPFINESLRKKLSRTALKITRACDYTGAGTVEFLVDKNMNYYFLEMNTRLQVEHPVTEAVNGLDLVQEQINVANGEALSFTQADIHPAGHAIECRIYAEDGFENFTPSTGKVLEFITPQGPGVRLDEGIRAGQEITPYYDPLLGKLITWGNTRDSAIRRMIRALGEFHIVGVTTTIPFCRSMILHRSFRQGIYCTKTLNEIAPELQKIREEQSEEMSLSTAVVAVNHEFLKQGQQRKSTANSTPVSGWLSAGRRENIR